MSGRDLSTAITGRQNHGIGVGEGLLEVLLDLELLQLVLPVEESRLARVGVLGLELPPMLHIWVVNADIGTHFGEAPDDDFGPAVASVADIFAV